MTHGTGNDESPLGKTVNITTASSNYLLWIELKIQVKHIHVLKIGKISIAESLDFNEIVISNTYTISQM